MKCKFYSDYICNHYGNGLCHYAEKVFGYSLPDSCNHIDDFENCTCFEPIEDKEKDCVCFKLTEKELPQTKVEMDIFEDMFEETPFGKVDKAGFANAVAQETAEDIISDLKNYIAEYGDITKSMLDELIEIYVSRYGVEVEDE